MPSHVTLAPAFADGDGLRAVAGHHIQNTGGQAGFERQRGHGQRAQRRLLGRLDDDGAACGAGALSCVDGGLGLINAEIGDLCEYRAGARVGDVKTRCSGDPGGADQRVGAEQ